MFWASHTFHLHPVKWSSCYWRNGSCGLQRKAGWPLTWRPPPTFGWSTLGRTSACIWFWRTAAVSVQLNLRKGPLAERTLSQWCGEKKKSSSKSAPEVLPEFKLWLRLCWSRLDEPNDHDDSESSFTIPHVAWWGLNIFVSFVAPCRPQEKTVAGWAGDGQQAAGEAAFLGGLLQGQRGALPQCPLRPRPQGAPLQSLQAPEDCPGRSEGSGGGKRCLAEQNFSATGKLILKFCSRLHLSIFRKPRQLQGGMQKARALRQLQRLGVAGTDSIPLPVGPTGAKPKHSWFAGQVPKIFIDDTHKSAHVMIQCRSVISAEGRAQHSKFLELRNYMALGFKILLLWNHFMCYLTSFLSRY